ncbi:MAG: hypothetical protein U0S49_08695 [Rhodospirillales bacterium]|nr:hypothetical protein [Rhodospirillales bacterium]
MPPLTVAHAPSPYAEQTRRAIAAGTRSPEIDGVEAFVAGPVADEAAAQVEAKPDPPGSWICHAAPLPSRQSRVKAFTAGSPGSSQS